MGTNGSSRRRYRRQEGQETVTANSEGLNANSGRANGDGNNGRRGTNSALCSATAYTTFNGKVGAKTHNQTERTSICLTRFLTFC